MCVFVAPLSQPFLLPGDLTNASAALLTPVCLKHFSSFGFPCHHLLLLLPPVLFHAVHCTNLLICSVGNISSCSLVLLICREKTRWKSLAVEVWPVKVCAGEETAISLCPVKSHPEIKVSRPSAGSELQTL